jgi:putative ABC transport system substrate-binding protein
VKRREFILLLAGIVGAVAAWPFTAKGQQPDRLRRVGVLMPFAANSAEAQAGITALSRELERLGWAAGRNIRIDTRWAAGRSDNFRTYAQELLALEPDVIVVVSASGVRALQQASRSVPIVFGGVVDPVGSGLVASWSRPGGNATGFVLFEYSLPGKWLQLLKEIAPGVNRAAVLRDPSAVSGIGQFAAIQAVASIGLDLSVIDERDAKEIERDVAEFAQGPSGGLIVTASPFGANHADLFARIAARHKLPAVYPSRLYVTAGGLMSYGLPPGTFSGVAGYVDRILRGEKPGNLPVQVPTKFELVINLKAAKAINLTVPPSLLARADEVIE